MIPSLLFLLFFVFCAFFSAPFPPASSPPRLLPCIFVLYLPLFARLVAASYPGPQRLSASACYLMPITHHSVARKVMDMVTRVPWG